MGSPMLDMQLGQVDAIHRVLKDLGVSTRASSGHKNSSSTGANQLDDNLPPEVPTSWIACELCNKWRRVAWHVDPDTLPELFECSMNTWDLDNARCEAPQDYYDPQTESTLQVSEAEAAKLMDSIKVGDWLDVFCTTNLCYYEAQVVKIAEMHTRKVSKSGYNECRQIKFHFKVSW